jgi:molecular chaperone Hsp33
MNNYLQKAYCMNQTVRIYAAITTDIVAHAQEIFNLWPTSCDALGRSLTIAAIMSATYKSGEFLNIKINGDGPIGRITIEATDGKVRGFVGNPGVFYQNNDGTLNITNGVGAGFIEVIKDLHMRQPFSSTAEIIKGNISDDFAYYFAKSEQIPSSVGLGVAFNEDDKVKAAGGFLIQIMPGCKDEYITILEERLKEMKPCTQMIEEGYNAEDIINDITGGDYQLLETKELMYECNCNKERFERGLKTLGKDELKDILFTDKKAEITCNFCNKKYTFNEEDLAKLIDEIPN